MSINTEIGIFCSLHENWEELLAQEPYCLKIKVEGDYVIFNYDMIHSDFSNPIVREARGIIFKLGAWNNPVCWAFNKFFNYGESHAEQLDWSTAFVTEKIDGSLIKMWWDWDGGWHISTNSVIDAANATIADVRVSNFKEYFYKALSNHYPHQDFFNLLDPDLTYIFELVGPYNRVVVEYDKPELFFLGARNKFTGEVLYCSEANRDYLELCAISLPKQYPLNSLADCINLANTYSWDQEGFVAADGSGHRVKIKSPAYVRAHFARNNNVITRRHLLRIILANEVEEFLCYAQDYKDQIMYCKGLLNTYLTLGNTFAKIGRHTSISVTRGAYAAMVKTAPKLFHDLMFANYDKEVSAKEYTANWSEDKWDKALGQLEHYLESLKVYEVK